MLIYKEIEKYLESCNCVFSSYDRYIPGNVNRRHIIEVELNDGSDVVFDILFNPTSTDDNDDLRYYLSIYNGNASGDLMKTYSNNNADKKTIINKVVKYKDRFKVKGSDNVVKLTESELNYIIRESLGRLFME